MDQPSRQAWGAPDAGTGQGAAVDPDTRELRAYAWARLALAGHLRVAREGLEALGREDAQRQLGELMVKLAEDRFTLAVLGQFKRGKSSLMNAIIGRDLLPTGVLPLTSAITVLAYGPTERLVVRRQDSMFADELPVSALGDYVTEKGNPGNRRQVRTARVELPVPFLRRGIEFVDTPGVGSAITANTATTYAFLPECDAVLFVTSVDTPMTALEVSFLRQIWEYVHRIFFVVNKTDLLSDGERSDVLGFVQDTVREQTGCGTVRVFPVSARQGLSARTGGDPALYGRSGLKALEEELAAFLSEEKASTFLAVVAQKALRMLDDEAAQGAFGENALRRRAMEDAGPRLWRDPHAAARAVQAARTEIEAVRRAILDGRLVNEMAAPQAAAGQERTWAGPEPAPAPPPPSEPDTEADLKTRGCPVCQHLALETADFLSHWQYRASSEEQAQAQFTADLGFCPLHTWQLLAIASPRGASIAYAGVAGSIARRLRESALKPSAGEDVRRLVRGPGTCRVCALCRQAELDAIRRLAALVRGGTGRALYNHSQGACLRHLAMLVDAVTDPEQRTYLLSHAAQRFEEDAEDMQTYAMKHDALRRDLQNRDEEDAHRRAVIRMVGGRAVCVPWAEDAEI